MQDARFNTRFYVGYAEDLRRGFQNCAAYWHTVSTFELVYRWLILGKNNRGPWRRHKKFGLPSAWRVHGNAPWPLTGQSKWLIGTQIVINSTVVQTKTKAYPEAVTISSNIIIFSLHFEVIPTCSLQISIVLKIWWRFDGRYISVLILNLTTRRMRTS